MCGFQILLGVDASLGRLDYSLMPDQALMEMLVEGLNDKTKEKYLDKHGMYLDVCEWSGISCDARQRVIRIFIDIDARGENVRSLLQLCHVPPKVKVLKISSMPGGKLTGSFDLTQLPCGMEHLYIHYNQLTGAIDLTQLPGGMKSLCLPNNQLTGVIDLTRLPDKMEALTLRNNQLTGVVDLTQLPGAMKTLRVNTNQLTGVIDLTKLPGAMTILHLNFNQLTGAIDLTQLPGAMTILWLENNQLTGAIDLTQLPGEMKELYLNDNQLTGSLVIKRLPSTMHTLIARLNKFNAVAVVDVERYVTIALRGSGVTSVVDSHGKELDDQRRFMKL